MEKFKNFKQLYQDNKFDVLLRDPESIYWLKLRSISRKELMVNFCTRYGIDCTNIKSRDDMIMHTYTVPEMKTGYPKMKIKPSAGLWGFMQSILP